MERTHIQLPDWLSAAARDVAAEKEISLAVTPRAGDQATKWQLPQPHSLESNDPFIAPDWREQVHTDRLRVTEGHEPYDADPES